MTRIEDIILSNLISNRDFTHIALPHLKQEYFSSMADKKLFTIIQKHIEKFSDQPSKDALRIELEKSSLSGNDLTDAMDTISSWRDIEESGFDWLVSETEQFCKDKAVYNAIYDSIDRIEKDDNIGMIPDLLTKALSIAFDVSIGHDLIEDAQSRFAYYHKKEDKIPFGLEFFNKITKGGISSKTLNVILGGTGGGKTLFMTDFASSFLTQSKNVLYITLEMSEEKIAERIDANLLDISLDDLRKIPKKMYEDKIETLRNKTQGKLIVKEYPTSSANAGHFRALINELKLKKKFVPDVVFVDYINICSSMRLNSSNFNSYSVIKSIAEELRGLAVEFKVPLFTATQTTRSGYNSSDVGLEDTSESFGLPATADLMFAIINTEELAENNSILIKQLKNRDTDPNINRRFIVKVDKTKMKLYNAQSSDQKDLHDTNQTTDDEESEEKTFVKSKKRRSVKL